MIIVIAAAIVFAIVILLLAINRKPIDRSPEDVAAILRSLINGSLSSAEWDYFVSVGIRNPALENIRVRCIELWKKDSPYLKAGAIDPTELSELGIKQIQELQKECEEIKRARQN